MRQNIRLDIAYDGTRYRGWQKTSSSPSIEEHVEKALQIILQEEVTLQAASRTDAGVHAWGQVVNFFTSKDNLTLLQRSMNGLLPNDIIIRAATLASPDFHPTLDCTGKWYRYHINIGPVQLPHLRFTSWHVVKPHLSLMQDAAKLLLGEHDFTAFCNHKNNETYATTIRSIDELEIKKVSETMIQIDVKGSNFLYKMVRNIVGTITYVGMGKIAVDEITTILHSKDRRHAGITAPAQGLTLQEVFF